MATRIAIEDAVSDHSGVDSLSGAACTSDAQCDRSHGSICARRFKAASGRCSPTWFGLCHAWADYGGGVDQWGNGDNIVAKFTPK